MKCSLKIMKIVSVLVMTLLAMFLTTCGGDLPDCGTTFEPYFTIIPLDLNDVKGIVPLGQLGPPGHTLPTGHHYFYLTDPKKEVPVRSPGDVWITTVTRQEIVNTGYTDYSLEMASCAQFHFTFGHLSTISQAILEEAGSFGDADCDTSSTGGTTFRGCSKDVKISVSAGEVIGTIGGNLGQHELALDFGAIDKRVAAPYPNQDRFGESDYLHIVSPIDYFEESLKHTLKSRSSDYSGTIKRTIEPVVGEVLQEEFGTAQGIWFYVGDPIWPEDHHLAMVHHNIDPTKPVFSVGTSIPGLSSGVYTFTPIGTGTHNRDFSDIKADGQTYSFGDLGGSLPDVVIIIQLINSLTLRIEKQSTSDGPPWSFTGNAVDFVK